MKILLINVDANWNVALRRMMNYYTAQGHEVEMRDLKMPGFPHKKKATVDAAGFDLVCVSNLFERNAYCVTIENCDRVEYGGIGSRNPHAKLSEEIEATPPFMGSGTTAVAALKTGRNYIGFELDEKYHAIAQQRIAETLDGMLEEEGGQASGDSKR